MGGRARNPGFTGWCETPVAERTAEPGCDTTAITDLGPLPRGPLFWHLDAYADRTDAEAARGPRGTVVDGHGRHWLFTIADEGWRPGKGDRVAAIGPLGVDPGVPYTAHYLETVIPPGFQDGMLRHRHPGPEAWFMVSGAQCLETPNGVMTARSGQSMLAPEGSTTAVDAKPDAPHSHWTPQGLCPK